ncbi:MAG: hypothetical protein HQL89_11200 [Magnetococcales bacterium]|nr:hypothetical protein [Magnetococcales bacterium]
MSRDERRSLLIIDDNQAFLDNIDLVMNDRLRVTSILSNEKLEIICSRAKEAHPEFFLLDVNLHRSSSSQQILKHLTDGNYLPENCRIWMISNVAGNPNTIETYQEINCNVESYLLQKPIHREQLLAVLLKEVIYEFPSLMNNDFPLPVRILHSSGNVFSNPAWQSNPTIPDPTPNQQEFFSNRNMPRPKGYQGCPFNSSSIGYTLYPFKVLHDQEEFLGEIAAPHPDLPHPDSLKDTVQMIFNALAGSGFIRGRFYRIQPMTDSHKPDDNNINNLLILEHVSQGHLPDLESKLPLYRPLRGELKRRLFEEYNDVCCDALAYKIRTKDDDPNQDEDITWLNKKIGIVTDSGGDTNGEILSSWLEVPVFSNPLPDFLVSQPNCSVDLKKTEREMVGLMVFDRLSPQKDNFNNNSMLDTGDRVEEPHVKMVEVFLNSLLLMMGETIRKDVLHEALEFEKYMKNIDCMLDKNRESRYKIILEGLCSATDAMSAIMVTHNEYNRTLEVEAVHGVPKVPACVNTMEFPCTATYHPIIAAWKEKRPFAYPDFQNDNVKTKIIAQLKSNRDSHWQKLSSSDQHEMTEWLNSVGGVMAIPVTVSEQCIGGITLQFKYPWRLTRTTDHRIRTVLHRVRWVLQDTVQKKREQSWYMLLGHDIKGCATRGLEGANELIEKYPGIEKDYHWRRTKHNLTQVLDLGLNWLDLLRPAMEMKSSFLPRPAFENYIYLDDRCDDEQFDGVKRVFVNWSQDESDPVWQTKLTGQKEVFARIVRGVLDNAFKFGLHYCDLPEYSDLYSEVKITIFAEILQEIDNNVTMLSVQITNPGTLSDTPNSPRGTRIDMKAAKTLIQQNGGNFRLETGPDGKTVIATLEWPIEIL